IAIVDDLRRDFVEATRMPLRNSFRDMTMRIGPARGRSCRLQVFSRTAMPCFGRAEESADRKSPGMRSPGLSSCRVSMGERETLSVRVRSPSRTEREELQSATRSGTCVAPVRTRGRVARPRSHGEGQMPDRKRKEEKREQDDESAGQEAR